jgi:hypothetical protein
MNNAVKILVILNSLIFWNNIGAASTVEKLEKFALSQNYRRNFSQLASEPYYEASYNYGGSKWLGAGMKINGFLNTRTKLLSQVSFSLQRCSNSDVSSKDLYSVATTQIKLLYKSLFLEELPGHILDKLSYPVNPFQLSNLSGSYKKIRLKTVSYKCDAQGGDGYKLDFFGF